MRDAEKALENEIDAISEACFSFLVQHPEDLQRFMIAAGYDAQTIAKAVGSRSLALGMIEYFVRSEPLLLALTANAGIRPERFEAVWQKLNREA
jgi:hypothetical protein